jgi:Single Cache domain 2
MKKTNIIFTIVFCLCLSYTSQAIAQESSSNYTPYFPNFTPLTPQEIMEYARSGAEYLEKGGDVQEFNKNPGKFTKGVFLDYRYLAILDCKTKTALAHPFVPKAVNVIGLFHRIKDARGRAYMAELCTEARNNPKGAWIVSFVGKPGGKTIDLLYQYAVQVKNTDLIVGAFSRDLKLESYLDQRAREEERILNSLVK